MLSYVILASYETGSLVAALEMRTPRITVIIGSSLSKVTQIGSGRV